MEILVVLVILYFVFSTLISWMRNHQEQQEKMQKEEMRSSEINTVKNAGESDDALASSTLRRLGRSLAEQPDWQQMLPDWQKNDLDWQQMSPDWQKKELDWQKTEMDWQKTAGQPHILGADADMDTSRSVSSSLTLSPVNMQTESAAKPLNAVKLVKPVVSQDADLRPFTKANQAIEGMIWSEIYAPPRAKRPHRTSFINFSYRHLR